MAVPAVGRGDWRDGHRGFRSAVVPGDGHHRLDEADREEQHREKELHQTRADNRRKGTDKSLQGYGIGITRQIEKKSTKRGGQTAQLVHDRRAHTTSSMGHSLRVQTLDGLRYGPSGDVCCAEPDTKRMASSASKCRMTSHASKCRMTSRASKCRMTSPASKRRMTSRASKRRSAHVHAVRPLPR